MPIDEVLISARIGDGRIGDGRIGDVRAAGRERGVLVELAFGAGAKGSEDPQDPRGPGDVRVGDVYLGRVRSRVPAMGGAFVDIGPGRPGLLMAADGPEGRLPSEGDTVVVRVLRAAEGEKGPKLAARVPDAGAGDACTAAAPGPAPRRLARGPDPVQALLLRADAAGALARVVVDDPHTLVRLRTALPALAPRLQPWRGQAPLFEAEGVNEAIEAALDPRVPLPGGGRLVIEETAALVAIDVDLGSEAGGSAKAAALACDLQAAAAIGRQLRLRELAGRIVIDFVPIRRPADRARVLAALQAGLDDGERSLRLGGWTRLGLVELIREKRGPSLAARLGAACPACGGAGRLMPLPAAEDGR